MAGRKATTNVASEMKVDMTPLIDVCFLLITFFLMLTTVAKDEAAQQIELPVASMAPILQDEEVPDSLNINVAWKEKAGVHRPFLLGWGREVDLREPGGMDLFRKLLKNNAALLKRNQQARGSYDEKEGLTTTLIVRVDQNVDYEVFRNVMEVCRESGFRKFQLKADSEEEDPNAKT